MWTIYLLQWVISAFVLSFNAFEILSYRSFSYLAASSSKKLIIPQIGEISILGISPYKQRAE
jgi:hypothetical protein